MWTLNETIRTSASSRSQIFVQFPNFENHFCGYGLSSGKVDNVVDILNDPEGEIYAAIADAYSRVVKGDPGIMCNDGEHFSKLFGKFIHDAGLSEHELWQVSS